jgi:hypothetical protein
MEELPNLMKRQPDISQSQPGNRSAEEIVARDARNHRIVVNEVVLTPIRRPGEDEEENPQFQTEQDVYDGQQSTHVFSGMLAPFERWTGDGSVMSHSAERRGSSRRHREN